MQYLRSQDHSTKATSREAKKVAVSNLLEINVQKEKKAAEKNTRLIKQLSTVAALNPYQYAVASPLYATAWRRAAESLIEQNALENTVGARRCLKRSVIRCVTDYRSSIALPEATRKPNRELTEIESLAKEICQLQENGAPNSVQKKSQEIKCNISANHAVVLDSEESMEEVAAGGTSSNLLLVQCVPSEKSENLLLPSSFSGMKQLPILRAGSRTPDQPNPAAHKPRKPGARSKCALCPYRPSARTGKVRSVFRFPKDDLRQKMWIKVCREMDQDFKLCTKSFVCEEHFAPESFGVPRMRNGVEVMRLQWFAVPSLSLAENDHRQNLEAAFESDGEMEIDEERLEYDNGLPTAPDLPSGLLNTRNSDQPSLFGEGKENICESISCSTCGVSQEPCWNHANFIKDKNANPLALSSLPRQLDFRFDRNEGSPLGVLSRGGLRSHTVFGPMRGALCSHISSRFAIHDSTSLKCYHLDSDDTCNWMKYVQFADNAQDQNLAVYVREGQIFFVATREIQPNEELKLWYSRKYADGLGCVRKDELNIAEDVEDGMRVTDDRISQKDEDDVAFTETEENISRLIDFDETTGLDSVHDPEERTLVSTEQTASPRSNRTKRKKSAGSLNERTDNEICQEAIPVVDNTTTSAERSTKVSDPQPAFELPVGSSEILPVKRKRKKVETGPVKSQSIIKFGCSECWTHFPTEKLRILHNYQHSDEFNSKERTCPKCGAMFDNLRDLSLHVKMHGKRYFPKEECVHCGALVASLSMKQHFCCHHPELPIPSVGTFPCKKCGIEFDSLNSYREHAKNHGFRIECLYCGKKEVTGVAMDEHLLLHMEKDGFRCPKCPKVCAKYLHLTRHYVVHNRVNPRKKPTNADVQEGTAESPQKKIHPVKKTSKFFVDPSTKIKFPCAICQKSYKTEAVLEVHRRFHERELDKLNKGDDIEKACPECGEEFDTLDALFRHVEGHAVYFYAREPCPVCKKFISSHMMQRHVGGNHPSGQTEKGEEFPCEVCKKVFPTEIKHRAHFQMHKPKKCLLCAEIFEGWIELGRHAVDAHRQADGFHCPNCDVTFPTFRHMTTHHRNNHDIRSIVSCEVCGQMCKNKLRLYAHMDSAHRSKEFAYECKVCGRKFMRHDALRQHVDWAHTAAGRKRIQDSQVAYMKKGYVAPRKRMLLEEFPFKCEKCQVGFLTEGRILRHRTKFHSDEA